MVLITFVGLLTLLFIILMWLARTFLYLNVLEDVVHGLANFMAIIWLSIVVSVTYDTLSYGQQLGEPFFVILIVALASMAFDFVLVVVGVVS